MGFLIKVFSVYLLYRKQFFLQHKNGGKRLTFRRFFAVA